jgi:hypothetical protein
MALEQAQNGIRQTYSSAAVAEAVMRDPADTLTRLKELAIKFSSNKTELPPELAQEGLELLSQASRSMQSPLILQSNDDFPTVWAFARFAHRLGQHRDALGWAKHAAELEPDNLKVQGRTVEILLDLAEEIPGASYAYKAHQRAIVLDVAEHSPYSRGLRTRAYSVLNNGTKPAEAEPVTA